MNRLTSCNLECRLSDEQKILAAQRVGFKFFSASVAPFVFERGSILIGTGQKYRRIESASRVDVGEMTSSMFVDNYQRDFWKQEQSDLPVGSYLENMIKPMSGAHSVRISNLTISHTFDFYVYCFSYECTKSVRDSLQEDADCVSRIRSVDALAEVLIQHHPNLVGLKYCIYPVLYGKRQRNKTELNPSPFDAAFEKEQEFCANKEGRIVFYKINPDTGQPCIDQRPLPIPLPFEHPRIRRLFMRWPLPT